MFIRTPHFKHLRAVLIFLLILLVCFYTIESYDKNKYQYQLVDIKYPALQNYERKDWHDYKFMNYEAEREGPGEQGSPHVLTDPEDIKLNKELFQIEGLYVVVSDKISVNRSVPDVRIQQYLFIDSSLIHWLINNCILDVKQNNI